MTEKYDQSALNGKSEWMERYGSYIKRAATWRLIAIVALGAVCVLTFGIVSIAKASKVVPYVVEVDKLGDAVAVGPASKAQLADKRIIRYQLAAYIKNARSITSDAVVQKGWLNKVYAITGKTAAVYLNNYYKKNDPFDAAKTSSVEVSISSVVPLSKNSWQVHWEETNRDLSGNVNQVTHWTAVLTIGTFIPKGQAEIIKNPTGVVVNNLSWTQVL